MKCATKSKNVIVEENSFVKQVFQKFFISKMPKIKFLIDFNDQACRLWSSEKCRYSTDYAASGQLPEEKENEKECANMFALVMYYIRRINDLIMKK